MNTTITPAPTTVDLGWNAEVSGIERRLVAGVRSMRERGFSSDELGTTSFQVDGWHRLTWDSRGGLFGTRPWVIEAEIRLENGRLGVREVTFAVTSPRTGETTTWAGGCLPGLVSQRLVEVLGVIGARISEPTGDLTKEEVEAYHNLHPSPVKAFKDASGRVVLEDDDWGSGFLSPEGDAAGITRDLLEAGFAHLMNR